jgi:O-antigen ligase
MASVLDGRQLAAGLSNVAVAVTLGSVATVGALLASVYGVTLGIGLALLIPTVVAVVLMPRLGTVLFLVAISTLEEYPGGLSDQVVERSARLPFYSVTLGLPAVYPPDAIIAGLLGLYWLRKLIWGRGYGLKLDLIGGALILVATSIALSILFGLTGDQPLGPEVLDLSLLGAIKLPEAAARYIAVLQIKIFLLLFGAYVLGLVYFRSEADLRQMGMAVAFGMLATIALGAWRVYGDPSMIRKLVAVIYDTGTVTLMALAVFYVVSKWACGLYTPLQTVARVAFCALLMLLIVLSFRRTLWGAIALSTVLLPFIAPQQARARLLALMAMGVLAIGALIVSVPGGQALLHSIVARAGETNLNDPSTLYRFSLLVWMVERFGELPLFGWGIKPLWNETVHIRWFTSNMENVHSLYFWILTRFGVVGLFAFGVALGLVVTRIVQVSRKVTRPEHKILLMVVFISIVLYLFGGIFNPVYANVRLVIPLGLGLAIVTRLPEIAAAGEARPG